MPAESFALEEGGPERLEIAWQGNWKDVTIRLDGEVLGTIPGRRELSDGQSYRLPDGSTLDVQLVRQLSSAELRVSRNGDPLPGSASDPAIRLRSAYGVVFFLSLLNIVLGLLGTLHWIDLSASAHTGLYSIVFGAFYLLLGVLAMRMSAAALIIAMVVFAIDGILGAVLLGASNPLWSTGGLAVRALLIVPMVRGVQAIRALRRRLPGKA
jgi:hypothetical protein